MKKLFLSNSQIDTYSTCQRKWYHDKVLKLRPNFKPTPLLFGGALDNAVEHYLLKESGDYKDVFLAALNNFDINGAKKTLPENILDVKFGAGDCDETLIDQDELDKYCTELGAETSSAKDYLEYFKKMRKAKKTLPEVEQKIFNYCAYLSLQQKGLMLLEKLVEWIDENVVELISAQKKIEITNEHGDKFIGYLDFVVKLKDGRTVLIDLKTSSNPSLYYPSDSASNSRQLGIYSQEEGIKDVAYLIADKNIRKTDSKRGTRARISVVEGYITEEHLDKVFDEIEESTVKIKESLSKGKSGFPKNLDSCGSFGGCQYRAYCNYGSKKGLEQC